jgi:hypothetical protein
MDSIFSGPQRRPLERTGLQRPAEHQRQSSIQQSKGPEFNREDATNEHPARHKGLYSAAAANHDEKFGWKYGEIILYVTCFTWSEKSKSEFAF